MNMEIGLEVNADNMTTMMLCPVLEQNRILFDQNYENKIYEEKNEGRRRK